jgi:hypothetical protein
MRKAVKIYGEVESSSTFLISALDISEGQLLFLPTLPTGKMPPHHLDMRQGRTLSQSRLCSVQKNIASAMRTQQVASH